MESARYRVLLRVKDASELATIEADTGCMPRRRLEDGTLEIVAEIDADAMKKLKRKRTVQMEVLANATEEGKRSAGEVSRGNRYADGKLPKPLGLREVRRVD
jgi:hypothetical protein